MRGWTRIHPEVQTGAEGVGALGKAADGSKVSPAFQLRSELGARHGAEQDPLDRTVGRGFSGQLGAAGAIRVLVLVALHSASLLLPAPCSLAFPRADTIGTFAVPPAWENGECFTGK